MDSAERAFDIEVAFADEKHQLIIALPVVPGTTVYEAIQQSKILTQLPPLTNGQLQYGIFSRIVSIHEPVKPGDRVEIYTPLKLDPKEQRVRRAQAVVDQSF